MSKLRIFGGPDRIAFVNSLFAEIDSNPMPGFAPPPHSRGKMQPPSYKGEVFLTNDEDGKERKLLLIITASKRKGRNGMVQEFTAILWAVCDEFRDLIFGDHLGSWVEFKGEFDFITETGWLEQVKSRKLSN